MLAGGGFSNVSTETPIPLATSAAKVVDTGLLNPVAPAKMSWFAGNWWWLLILVILIGLAIYFWRRGVMKK